MAEGVRKRGKTWSYYFDTAKINGERKKVEKGGFRTQKEALEARAAAIAEYERIMRFNEDIIRYMTIKVDEFCEGLASSEDKETVEEAE